VSYLIHKNNQKIGPYSIEEINTYIQQSSLSANDLCWQEGWSEWRPLSSILSETVKVPDPHMEKETELFQGSPSFTPVYLLGVGYGFILILGIYVGLKWKDGLPWIILATLLIAAVHLVFRFLEIRSVKYFISTSRIRITTGILDRHVKEIELYRIQDTSAFQSLFSRILGKGSLFIVSGDKSEPRIEIKSVPNHEELREKLRNAVLSARQKAKVRENSSF
jgi:membrane protein YdbS with pleckstrin-like domain